MYKVSRYVTFEDVTDPAFLQFYFEDHQALENSCSFLISDTHDSQSFVNEILEMKISRKASRMRKP